MVKLVLWIGIIAVAGGAYLFYSSRQTMEEIAESDTSLPDTGGDTRQAALVDGVYVLNKASSSMTWEGRKPLIPGYVDKGIIALETGSATVSGGAVTEGSVVVDMNTIETKSTGKGAGESMMQNHLKSEDFFDVEKYPTAKFEFESLTPTADGAAYNLRGTLTIKGVTNPVEFPASLTQKGNTLTMTAAATLDRTLWNIKYGSGKFFKQLGDALIDDMFTVRFTVVGEKK